MPGQIFMKSGRFYRRLFKQEGRTSQFMQLNPKPRCSLHCDLAMYFILACILRTISLLENGTKFCDSIENRNSEHMCPGSNHIVRDGCWLLLRLFASIHAHLFNHFILC